MKLYKYDIRNLNDKEYIKWYSLMNGGKQRRVDRLHFVEDKKRTVSGEMLARKAISEWCGVAQKSINFLLDEYGKPYVKDLPVKFNISHSGNIVVCAVNDSPIGVDIEQIRPIDLKIAKRIFSDKELLYLFGHLPMEQDFNNTTDVKILTRFFELWTAKEAYGKCIGVGIYNGEIQLSDCIEILLEEYVISIYKQL